MSGDLARFLADRYDEAEAAARDAAPFYADRDLTAELVEEGFDAEVGQHAERHNPAHRLADIKLKRAILALHRHSKAQVTDPGEPDFGCIICHYAPDHGIFGDGWCATARQLGTEFASHPDYKPEWAPEGAPDGT